MIPKIGMMTISPKQLFGETDWLLHDATIETPLIQYPEHMKKKTFRRSTLIRITLEFEYFCSGPFPSPEV